MGRARTERRETEALVDYVSDGTAMLASGDTLGAYDHFTRASNWDGEVPVRERQGRFRLIRQLLSNDDLVEATGFLACNSSAWPEDGRLGTVIMASCSIGTQPLAAAGERTDESTSESLVEQLQHEAATIAAEEWLHLVQGRTHRTLAGIRAREADVAAHLANLGIELSNDFLTRYPERAAWTVEVQPARAAEVVEFGRTHDNRFTPGPRAGGLVA